MGTVQSTPLPWLLALSPIEPPDIRQELALLQSRNPPVEINLERDQQYRHVSSIQPSAAILYRKAFEPIRRTDVATKNLI